MKNNYEHVLTLNTRHLAIAIWNLAQDCCAYCPKNMEQRCREDCCDGILEWLRGPYIPTSDVWKELKER